MARIDTSTEIDAPPERVWEVFSEWAAWPEWNPFVRRIGARDGGDVVRVGARLEVRIEPPGARGMTFRPRVVEAEAGRRLVWLGHLGVRGLFDGRHAFELEPLDGGRTRFVQSETFRGLLVPFTGGMLEKSRRGFEAMNRALRERVESDARETDTD